ncbi:MAG: 4-vinyl reductase, partial [Candidatus Diapherotrites archaeon]
LHGKAKLPVDHFLRGVFAGLFTDAFKKDMDCVETECAALNTNKCKFVIKEAADFDFKKPEPRRQLRVK